MTQYRFGKHPPKHDYRTLRFKNYVLPSLAPPPPSFDSKERVYAAVGSSDAATVFPMDANDQYGNCTIAARYHCDTISNAFIGQKVIKSARAAVKLYFHLTGGVDSGLNMLDVMNDWQAHRAHRDNILAFVSIDPNNHEHLQQQACALFGLVYIGFQCQQAIIDDFNNHRPWTPGPLLNEGHCVVMTGYTGSGQTDMINVLTWGADYQQGTWAWWDECAASSGNGEAYAAVPYAAQDPNFAPGFDIAKLEADLEQVAN